ncbi:MAG: hypothetical protein Q8S54_19685 [Bacteroidota bacterium]|nr:hypothetical protein [Bacteroidota bacterium]
MNINETTKSESNLERKRIDFDQIEQSCISGFLNYLLDKDSIKIQGKNVIIAKNEVFTKHYFKIDLDFQDVISRLYIKEKVKIDFEARYELFEKNGQIDIENIFVETSFACGYLSRDDDNSLHFEIESVSFKFSNF